MSDIMRLRGILPVLPVLVCGLATGAFGQSVNTVETGAPVERIIATADGALVEAGGDLFALAACDTGSRLCLTPSARPAEAQAAPEGALPDGRIAPATTGDIRQAWYGRPTTRYAHGVLGDAIEAGSLVAVTASGEQLEIVLPAEQVFEDITPRIADLDGDGTNEVITIRASKTGGAAVAIFGLADGKLALRSAGSENGQTNRWLNIAGFLPRDDGGLTLYGVRTPHIGGRLFSLDLRNGALSERNDIAIDLSNHIIGSRELGMSAVGEFDGRIELVLPSQDRRRLRFPLTGRADIVLPGSIDKPIIAVDGRLVTATADGTLIVVSP
ncbi:hypothetical protein [Hoeflea sp. EC-HK425]|uniref:hypothetical protein n=1 Tax=Hoeflea sp. EC-HK425 TaxID=2038388 RepID=UPI00125F1B7C|nr:hypothetical protein [Hoeflea sp. EC-HK425]